MRSAAGSAAPRGFLGDPPFAALTDALLGPRLRGRVDARIAAIGGVTIAVVLVPLAPAGLPVIAAAVAVPVALRWTR